MATYKHTCNSNETYGNYSQDFLLLRQPNYRLSIYFQQINIVHKNIQYKYASFSKINYIFTTV